MPGRSPAPAGRRAARQRVQAFCRRQNLASGRIHFAPTEIKSGVPGRRKPDGAELRRGDRQAAGQVNSRKLPRAGHRVSGPFPCFGVLLRPPGGGPCVSTCKCFAGGKTLRRGGFTPPRLKSNPGPPDGGSRTGPNFAEEIAKQLGK